MKSFKTIKNFYSAFGGFEYRVTSNGVVVNYQELAPARKSFMTCASEPYEGFKIFAEESGLFDPYKNDPGVIPQRIDELNGD